MHLRLSTSVMYIMINDTGVECACCNMLFLIFILSIFSKWYVVSNQCEPLRVFTVKAIIIGLNKLLLHSSNQSQCWLQSLTGG